MANVNLLYFRKYNNEKAINEVGNILNITSLFEKQEEALRKLFQWIYFQVNKSLSNSHDKTFDFILNVQVKRLIYPIILVTNACAIYWGKEFLVLRGVKTYVTFLPVGP